MSSILNAICDLTDTKFHRHLRSAGRIESLPSGEASSRTRRDEILQEIQPVLAEAIRSGPAPLKLLRDKCEVPDQVLLAGEGVLALQALAEMKYPAEQFNDLRELVFTMINELDAKVEHLVINEGSEDEELIIHTAALREWAHLMAEHFEALGDTPRHAQMMFIRAKVTNVIFNSWPNLVGDAMVSAARVIEAFGKVDMAQQMYHGVRMDLGYTVDRIDDPSLPEFELHGALYWFEQACLEGARLDPDDETIANQLKQVQALRSERNLPDYPATPRFGPIARTYLDRIPWLALATEDLHGGDESNISAVCRRFGCSSGEVDFYISAMGSYFGARPMLEPLGVTMMYEDAHQEVFDAIEYAQKSHGQE